MKLSCVRNFLSRSSSGKIPTNKRLFSTSNSSQFQVTISTPYQVICKEKIVKQVDIPATDGTMGILSNHVPTLGTLKPGIINVITDDSNQESFMASAGLFFIGSLNKMHVLCEEIVPSDEVDAQKMSELQSLEPKNLIDSEEFAKLNDGEVSEIKKQMSTIIEEYKANLKS